MTIYQKIENAKEARDHTPLGNWALFNARNQEVKALYMERARLAR